MFQNVLQPDAVPGPGFEAFVDQIDQGRRLAGRKDAEFALNGVFFFAKGDVAKEHVVEQEAERPDGGRFRAEFVMLEEFGRTPDARAVEVGVGVDAPRIERQRGAEVDQLQTPGIQIHHKIFVFDVVVENAAVVNRLHHLHGLAGKEDGVVKKKMRNGSG